MTIAAGGNVKAAEQTASEAREQAGNKHFKCIVVQVDVTSPDSCKAMMKAHMKAFGRLDYAINSAGVCVLHCGPRRPC